MATTVQDAAEHAHADNPALAHHFESELQQFDSSKLGMWLFLATEILFFGGLFCAYAIYRAFNPEIFAVGHKYLDTWMGAVNTVILLASSFTMAWAVRAAQLSQQKLLITLLSLTLAGGLGFMVVKFFEYKSKWDKGYLPGQKFEPHAKGQNKENGGAAEAAAAAAGVDAATAYAESDAADNAAEDTAADDDANAGSAAVPTPAASAPDRADDPVTNAALAGAGTLPTEVEIEGLDRSLIAPAASSPAGTITATEKAAVEYEATAENVHIFFGIYFAMTGLHVLHVVAGLGVITWLIVRSVSGHFSASYFTPVDLGGLYWHLVDLIWIFLFPLLYLIH